MIFDQVRDYGFIESTYLVGNVLKMIGWFSKDIGGSFHGHNHAFQDYDFSKISRSLLLITATF